MKTSNIFILLMIAAVTFLSSCGDDAPAPAPVANVTFTPSSTSVGDVGGDVGGNGGTTTKSYNWQNNSSTAEVNMDLTSSKGGSMQMIVKDAANNTVLDRTLTMGTTPDSFSGVTATGTPGAWTVTINLSSFNGDGSFSISQGN